MNMIIYFKIFLWTCIQQFLKPCNMNVGYEKTVSCFSSAIALRSVSVMQKCVASTVIL